MAGSELCIVSVVLTCSVPTGWRRGGQGGVCHRICSHGSQHGDCALLQAGMQLLPVAVLLVYMYALTHTYQDHISSTYFVRLYNYSDGGNKACELNIP